MIFHSYPCCHEFCSAKSEFFATDNVAKYGHLCYAHWISLPIDEAVHYEYSREFTRENQTKNGK